MARRKHFAICTEAFTHTTPSTVLEIRGLDGALQSTIECPPMHRHYTLGQRVEFGTLRAARAFCAAHAGKFKID
jgi:hypothetical protein